MSSSGLSELSSSLSSGGETPSDPVSKDKLDHYFKHGSSTPSSPPAKKKRPPSPPHEAVLADNADIAFICIFRSRFSDAFQKSLPHYGPQDIEFGVVGNPPSEHVERLLCALLGLVLNRKKDVEKGHYQRALEEAVQTHASQWPAAWQGANPLHGGRNFNNMTPEQRLTLMKTLIIWALESSEAIKSIIKDSYKNARHEDDLNQPLSVQPWGRDGDKRRFWLIEGQDDTHFRLYRESNPALKINTWRSIAGTIEEVKQVADYLAEENTQASRRLRDRIHAAIPRFEASEDKRKRRDYRVARKAQFTRADPAFSLYEGRTRGKRVRYTYSDEDGGSDTLSPHRSNRQSGISTPAEPVGPTYTASGRQVKSRHGGASATGPSTGQYDARDPAQLENDGLDRSSDDIQPGGRPKRSAQSNGVKARLQMRKKLGGYDSEDEMNDESDITSSGNEWQGGDEDEAEADENLNDDDMEDDSDIEMHDLGRSNHDNFEHSSEDIPQSGLMVTLHYAKGKPLSSQKVTEEAVAATAVEVQGNHIAQTEVQQSMAAPNGAPSDSDTGKMESMIDAAAQSIRFNDVPDNTGTPEYVSHSHLHAPASQSMLAETKNTPESALYPQSSPQTSLSTAPLTPHPSMDQSATVKHPNQDFIANDICQPK